MKRILGSDPLPTKRNIRFDSEYIDNEVTTPACPEWLDFIRRGGLPALEAVLAPVARSVPSGETLH